MTTPQISRRTVTAGLAWSVPAVAAVTAAPFAAASPICPSIDSVGDAIKFPGNSKVGGLKQAYGFPVSIKNTTSEAIVVSAAEALIVFNKFGSKSGAPLLYTADPCKGGELIEAGSSKLIIEPGKTLDLFFVVNETGNSANDSGCITASFNVALLPGSTSTIDPDCANLPIPKVCFTATPPQGC